VTGQTLRGAFLDWYDSHEGGYYLGNPISQPVEERSGVVQYFDGGALFRDVDGNVSVLPIVRENARALGIDTSKVKRDGLPTYDELYFWEGDNPNPVGDPYATGRKWIEVNISEQRLYAYQGETLISTSLVSTGLEPNHTEQGVFHVRYKLKEQDMAGATGPNGEVIAMGEDAAENASSSQGQSGYTVEDVPHVMYFDMDAEALHGAYWHNNFGQRMSHGCINLPLDFATFLYGWAPLGTMVWVHD
jgi:lipoprotein-anchoring transpeptidase ErfK/SrfK